MTHVPATLKLQVEERAAGKCEYCRLSQVGQEARFHVDHIVPTKLAGRTTADNLCLACVSARYERVQRLMPRIPSREHSHGCFIQGRTSGASTSGGRIAFFMASPRLAGRQSRLFPSTGH